MLVYKVQFLTNSNTVLKYNHEDVNCLKCSSGVLNSYIM